MGILTIEQLPNVRIDLSSAEGFIAKERIGTKWHLVNVTHQISELVLNAQKNDKLINNLMERLRNKEKTNDNT